MDGVTPVDRLAFQADGVLLDFGAARFVRSRSRDGGDPFGLSERGGLGLAALAQRLERECPDRFEEVIAHDRGADVGFEHRLADQRSHEIEDGVGLQAVDLGDMARRVELEATGEHRHPLEQALQLGFEELVRPLDGGPHRLVTINDAAASTRQQPEAIIERVDDRR